MWFFKTDTDVHNFVNLITDDVKQGILDFTAEQAVTGTLYKLTTHADHLTALAHLSAADTDAAVNVTDPEAIVLELLDNAAAVVASLPLVVA